MTNWVSVVVVVVHLVVVLAGNVLTVPGPLFCTLVVVNGPLDWTESEVVLVVFDGCIDGSIIVDRRVPDFGLLDTLVFLLGSCDLLVAIRELRLFGKECSPPGGGDTRWTEGGRTLTAELVVVFP